MYAGPDMAADDPVTRRDFFKGMYVMAAEDAGERAFDDGYDATAYWGARTQAGVGPDRRPVGPGSCVHGGGRSCCE